MSDINKVRTEEESTEFVIAQFEKLLNTIIEQADRIAELEPNHAKRDLEMQAQGVESLQFPSMLRKMWASWEIQNWINIESVKLRNQAGDL